MNQEVKAKRIKALRSGEYEQGKNVLKSFDDKYCCLGVLCAELNEPIKTGEQSYLSASFSRLIGLKFIEMNNLCIKNDDEDRSFNEIADYIEVNL